MASSMNDDEDGTNNSMAFMVSQNEDSQDADESEPRNDDTDGNAGQRNVVPNALSAVDCK